MDLMFIDSNFFMLDELKMKLESELKNKPVIFYDQLRYYAEKGMTRKQQNALQKLFTENKCIVIYVRAQKCDEQYDMFFQRTLVNSCGLRKVITIELTENLIFHEEQIVEKVKRLYGMEIKK